MPFCSASGRRRIGRQRSVGSESTGLEAEDEVDFELKYEEPPFLLNDDVSGVGEMTRGVAGTRFSLLVIVMVCSSLFSPGEAICCEEVVEVTMAIKES